MLILDVGQKVLLDGFRTKIINRWGQGKYHTYVFYNGVRINCDPQSLIDNGRLELLEDIMEESEISFVYPDEPPFIEDYDDGKEKDTPNDSCGHEGEDSP